MPRITERRSFNGFDKKIERLGLANLISEVESAVTSFDLRIAEQRHSNGTKWIRQQIDAGFERFGGWIKMSSGGVDWTKSDSRSRSVGVEVQVSGRSDLLAVDVLHLNQELTAGHLDVGIIVVPDDPLSAFLTDRTPNLRTALRHINTQMAVRVIAFMHDGVGPSLPKMITNQGLPK